MTERNLNQARAASAEPTLTRTFGSEVLQPAALDAWPWPEQDPRLVDQPTRVRTQMDAALAPAAAQSPFPLELWLERSKDRPPAQRILDLLAHSAHNFNGVARVAGETEWRRRIERRMAKGLPIELVQPWGCKINNPAKRFDATGPGFSELVSTYSMAGIMERVEMIYPPGAKLHLITDTVFYNTAMGSPPPEMAAYRDALAAMSRLPGIAGRVEVHDYAELLAPDAAEFSALYERFALRLERDLDALVDAETWGRLFRSFRAAMNTRGLGLTYAQMRAVFGPAPDPTDPLVQRVDSMARDGLKTQLAIKLAADAMGFLDRWRPDHLRASCHKGLKHGRAVLGLRCYPEYYRSAKLLPYHGVALVTEHKGRQRMVIQPEMVLRGRTDLTRVTDERGATWCYLG